MIDFSMTEQQRMLVDTVRKFAVNEIRPVAAALDRTQDAATAFPADLIEKGMRLGLGNLLVPSQYGGYGGNLIDYALVAEELGYGDTGVADVFWVTMSLSRLIDIGGNDAQKKKWFTAMCDDPGAYILAGAMTEPSGGSEIFCPLPDQKFGVRTSAFRDGDEYVLNGCKTFITNAGVAKLYIVLARTDRNAPNMAGCSIFLVPQGTQGISFGKPIDKMGHRLSVVREVLFDNVRLPREYMLGDEGDGFKILLQCYEGNGVAAGASAVGLARAAYDAAFAYAQERAIWGQPLMQHESVAAKLVDMRMKIEASRALVWKMAWAAEQPELSQGLNKLGSLAKLFPTSLVREITLQAMEIFGGYGYSTAYPIEKLVRDALLFPIYDGANDVLKRFVGWRLGEVSSTAF
jgi:acyl-CoA dehydrogenase